MASEPDEFEIQVVKNCPSDATHYYLLRYDERGDAVRFPLERALRIRGPFEHPIDCKPGYWLAIYTSDHLGHHKIQHIGGRPHVEVRLNLPASVCAASGGADGGKTTQQLVEMLAGTTEEEDDAEGSLKATRIDAKKREIALQVSAKEQKLMLRAAKNKELVEGFLLNRHHRLETREQSDSMFRVQNQTVLMMERNFVLMEKMQEVLGRFAEIEKAAAQKMASPPPPVDYTPVLSSVVGAIRDIGVSALQRDDKKKLKGDEESPPVKAALTDRAGTSGGGSGSGESGASTPTPAKAIENTAPALSAPEKVSVPELLAIVERMQAERERLQSELAAERNRQSVLDEIRAERSSGNTPSTRAAEPARSAPSSQSSSPARNSHSSRKSHSSRSWDSSRSSHSPGGSPPSRATQPARTLEPPAERRSSRSSGLQPSAMPSQRTQAIERTAESAPGIRKNQPTPPAEPRRSSPGSLFPRPASRNAPCACGSGRKFKHCCMHKHRRPVQPEAPSRPAPPSAPIPTNTPGPKQESAPPERVQAVSKPEPSLPIVPALGNGADSPPGNPPPASKAASLQPSAEPRRDVPRGSQDTAATRTPPSASAPTVQGTSASVSPTASPTSGKPAPTPASASQEPALPPIELPPGVVREEVQELLVNMLAGKLLTDPDAPVARPQVPQVKEVDAVLVAPPKMDRETAEKLLRDGSTLEAFGAFLFFNPALRAALLSRRGK